MLYKSLRKYQIMHAIFRSAPQWSDSAPCGAQGSALSKGRVGAGHCRPVGLMLHPEAEAICSGH